MDTKHKVHNCDKGSAQFITSMKLLKHITEFQEIGMKDKVYYDECGFSCKTKNNLKAHE